jgi:hypothetical protein
MVPSNGEAAQARLPIGDKYALFALQTRSQNIPSGHLGDGYSVLGQLPFVVPEHWKKWVGTIQSDTIAKSTCYLVVNAPSREPEVLNEENRLLQSKVYHFYTGLTLAVPYLAHDEIIFLTGAAHQEEIDVRQINRYPPGFYVEGSRRSAITIERVRAAKRIAENIENFDATGRMERLGRMLTAFRTAHQSLELDTRLHQFVRVVEGFILPTGKQKRDIFASRVGQIVSGISSKSLGQLYTIRGTVEHLHGPTKSLRGTPRERHKVLMLRAIQVETLARYFIGLFLDSPDLWPHFSTISATKKFWLLSPSEQKALWSNGVDLSSVEREFKLPDNFLDHIPDS